MKNKTFVVVAGIALIAAIVLVTNPFSNGSSFQGNLSFGRLTNNSKPTFDVSGGVGFPDGTTNLNAQGSKPSSYPGVTLSPSGGNPMLVPSSQGVNYPVFVPSTPSTQPNGTPTPPSTQPTPPSTQPTPPSTQPTPPSTQPSPPSTMPTPPATQPTPPAPQPTPSSIPTYYKGACVVRDLFAPLPVYSDPDNGKGYAKLGKGNGFTTYGSVNDACTQADYTVLAQTYCSQNPGGYYQRQIGVYNQDNSFNATMASKWGANFIQCP